MARRLHNLRARRLKLGVSQYLVGCLAYYPPSSAQSNVSYVELHEDRVGDYAKRKVRAALIWLESAPRRARQEARAEAAACARIEAILAAPAGQGRDEIIIERLVDLLFDGRSEDFDALAARVDPALAERAGTEYLDACKPSIPEDKAA